MGVHACQLAHSAQESADAVSMVFVVLPLKARDVFPRLCGTIPGIPILGGSTNPDGQDFAMLISEHVDVPDTSAALFRCFRALAPRVLVAVKVEVRLR